MDWLWLILGLVVLLVGGESLVRGATGLARSLGISPMVIGMTVLAFGTSAPELAVNVNAALKGSSALTFGNVVGSNIANVGLILGITAIVQALRIHRTIVTREVPIMLAATGLAVVLGLTGDTPRRFDQTDGMILLAAFAVFLFVTVRNARREDEFTHQAEEETVEQISLKPGLASVVTVVGLTGVLLGSHWTVQGATGVARELGMSEALIGLTFVAVGTSLPELTTSLFSALKGHADLAVGNIVGSNVFNVLFILGVSATIRPVPVPADGGPLDLGLMAAFSVVFLPLAMTQKRLGRFEGFLLFAGYLSYMSWRALG